MKRTISILSVISLAFVMSVTAFAKTPTIDHLSKRQLNTLIATAKTPAEHQRIAEFYLLQAQDYLAQSKEHAQMAEQFRNNPIRNNSKYVINTVNHCEYWAQKYSEKAAKSQELANQHEQMATDAEKQGSVQLPSQFPISASLGK